jgi:hypothetical protein
MTSVLNWVVARIKEPSTWAGISAATLAISVELKNHTRLAAAVIAALIAVVRAEK